MSIIAVKVRTIRGGLAALKNKLRVDLIDLHGGLKRMSPVDTGDFRNAWTVDTIAMRIDNNSDHAAPLANGHSSQAPKGWIEAEVDRVFKR